MITNTTIIPTTDASAVTLAQAKKQLRLEDDFTEEDDLIESYIDSAQLVCENFINRAIGSRKFIIELDAFSTPITYEGSSNDTIEKIEYYAPGGTELTLLNPTEYSFKKSMLIECFDVKFKTILLTDKRDDAVLITIDQGWQSDKVPAPIKQAMLLLVSDSYERREDREQGYNQASMNLLRPYRKY